MIHYCSECGAKNNEINNRKPKFCGACGEPLDAAFKRVIAVERPAIATPKTVTKKPMEEIEDEEITIATPSINDCVFVPPHKMTIGDLAKMATPLRETAPLTNLPADIQQTQRGQ